MGTIVHMQAMQPLLVAVGAEVRRARERLGWTRRDLATASGVSERFLAQLEAGAGNISLVRFAEVATALGTSPAALLSTAPSTTAVRPLALLGVRGAGQSTLGTALAKRLGVPFVELDQRIEAAAGLTLAEVFELHGEAYDRRIERDVLHELLARPVPMVLATGGSIVNDRASFTLLRERCRTVWLRADAKDHWNRVIKQGDQRPMAKNPQAFGELEALLAARESLYAQAEHTVDTTGRAPNAVVTTLARLAATNV